MPSTTPFPQQGGCTCGEVRYEMTTKPLFVNCCHCTWCQRETGTAFALNAMLCGHNSGLTLPFVTPSSL